ncbi:protein serine/threonine phosphatase 2C [Gonapodya prolifera JEL478]|uniref:Protein serine/threonine phosphatase 2C n=1 Tax=Gonapodya prolifera (strain JEL478) TaxID=1344416 RepID=A0A139AZQ3_GONPJ|nr:protein serine/threonine phosphatase 2C [Gonapodya prolifera JEL478]|eukprot:KXS22222.1 protein serine/threonine phosphatase 2C [Gonapodya prolifera JEL478]
MKVDGADAARESGSGAPGGDGPSGDADVSAPVELNPDVDANTDLDSPADAEPSRKRVRATRAVYRTKLPMNEPEPHTGPVKGDGKKEGRGMTRKRGGVENLDGTGGSDAWELTNGTLNGGNEQRGHGIGDVMRGGRKGRQGAGSSVLLEPELPNPASGVAGALKQGTEVVESQNTKLRRGGRKAVGETAPPDHAGPLASTSDSPVPALPDRNDKDDRDDANAAPKKPRRVARGAPDGSAPTEGLSTFKDVGKPQSADSQGATEKMRKRAGPMVQKGPDPNINGDEAHGAASADPEAAASGPGPSHPDNTVDHPPRARRSRRGVAGSSDVPGGGEEVLARGARPHAPESVEVVAGRESEDVGTARGKRKRGRNREERMVAAVADGAGVELEVSVVVAVRKKPRLGDETGDATPALMTRGKKAKEPDQGGQMSQAQKGLSGRAGRETTGLGKPSKAHSIVLADAAHPDIADDLPGASSLRHVGVHLSKTRKPDPPPSVHPTTRATRTRAARSPSPPSQASSTSPHEVPPSPPRGRRRGRGVDAEIAVRDKRSGDEQSTSTGGFQTPPDGDQVGHAAATAVVADAEDRGRRGVGGEEEGEEEEDASPTDRSELSFCVDLTDAIVLRSAEVRRGKRGAPTTAGQGMVPTGAGVGSVVVGPQEQLPNGVHSGRNGVTGNPGTPPRRKRARTPVMVSPPRSGDAMRGEAAQVEQRSDRIWDEVDGDAGGRKTPVLAIQATNLVGLYLPPREEEPAHMAAGAPAAIVPPTGRGTPEDPSPPGVVDVSLMATAVSREIGEGGQEEGMEDAGKEPSTIDTGNQEELRRRAEELGVSPSFFLESVGMDEGEDLADEGPNSVHSSEDAHEGFGAVGRNRRSVAVSVAQETGYTVETKPGVPPTRTLAHPTCEDIYSVHTPVTHGPSGTTYHIFVLADGHGGPRCAMFASTKLPELIKEVFGTMANLTDRVAVGDILKRVVKETDEIYLREQRERFSEWKRQGGKDSDRPADDGCTIAVNVVVMGSADGHRERDEDWVATVTLGDTRTAVLASKPRSRTRFEVAFVSEDMDPGHPVKAWQIVGEGKGSGEILWASAGKHGAREVARAGEDVREPGTRMVGSGKSATGASTSRATYRHYEKLRAGRVQRPAGFRHPDVAELGLKPDQNVNLSDCLGNLVLKLEPRVFRVEADVRWTRLDRTRRYLIVMATDGLWDAMERDVCRAEEQARVVAGVLTKWLEKESDGDAGAGAGQERRHKVVASGAAASTNGATSSGGGLYEIKNRLDMAVRSLCDRKADLNRVCKVGTEQWDDCTVMVMDVGEWA